METNSHTKKGAIEELESYRQQLRHRIDILSRDLEAVERSMRLLQQCDEANHGALSQETEYSCLRPQDAVQQFLEDNPEKSFKPTKIAKGLRGLGYTKNSDKPTFSTVIRTACLRLAKKGIIHKASIDGKLAFSDTKKVIG